MSQNSRNLSTAKQALLEKWKAGKSRANVIPKRPDDSQIPLSFSQESIWFIDQLYQGSSFYNISGALHLQGLLDVKILQQSLNEIISRHEIWRTNFFTLQQQTLQVIQTKVNWELPIINLEYLAGKDWQSEVLQLVNTEARKTFDLTQDILVRAVLLRISAQEHIFLLTMHHSISDGWSIGVFAKELGILYAAFAEGKPSPLPTLPIQYADFAIWQRDRLQGEYLQNLLNYWKKQLGGELPTLQLHTDYPRPQVNKFVGRKHYFTIPKNLTEALNRLSKQEEVSLFMTLLAAFNILLYRYTNQEDILVGSPIANRNRPELEGMLGFFVNTLVMRTDLTGDPSFLELVHRVREMTLDAYAHQDLPFEKLVEELRPQRNLSLNPLFQVMLILQNTPMPVQEFAGLKLQSLPVDSGTAMLDIVLSVAESEQGLTGFLEYNTDLFDAATIGRFIDNFQTLLTSIVARPQQCISELPLLSISELQQVLWDGNQTDQDYPDSLSLHELFEEQAQRSPHNLALIDPQNTITYEQLNDKANQLAHYLQKLGVSQGTIVAICLERSVEMVVGVLAILKAGGAYLPLDPTYPLNRLGLMLSDSQASVLLTRQEISNNLPLSTAQPVYLDTYQEAIAQESSANLPNCSSIDDVAYLLYTSGTSGTPKGVLGTHRGTINGLNWFWRKYPPEPGEVCCHKTAISFGDSIWEIFAPLLQGLPAVIIPDAIVKDTKQFLETLTYHQVTRIILVPSLLRVILDSYSQLAKNLSKLKIWMTSGEALPLDLTKKFRQFIPSAKLLNFYGLSEVSANAITYDTSLLAETATTVLIGRPIDNTQAYVLDRHLKPTPIGVVGELYIGGIPLAQGYLHRPELNQERFINHPLIPGKKLYKTGDLVRYLNDSNLEYLGRSDDQVKIRGFRIELGEIEAVLLKHPTVKECVVIAQNYGQDEQRLVAYVVTDADQATIIPQLQSYLQANLPNYMLPSALAVVDAIPLTPSGKVDKRSLSQSNVISPSLNRTLIAPRDTWELTIAQIWENLLHIQPISIQDNFFDVGGHSLLATRLIAQINTRFAQNLPLSTLFQNGTVEKLAQIVRQQLSSSSGSPLVAIRSSGSRLPFFCIHPAGGNIITYPNLANLLDVEQPFYAIEQVSQQEQPELISIEDTATSYLKEIRAVQPQGPYLLGGWCYGGVVALEMAQQLLKQGEKVGLLAVMDAIIPEKPVQPAPDDDVKLLVRLAAGIKHIFGIDWGVSYQELQNVPANERFRFVMHKANVNNEVEMQQHFYSYQLFKAHAQAFRDYVPQIYPQEITLFKATEEVPRDFQSPEIYSDDHLLGWGKCSLQPIKLIEVPGNHFTMFTEPHVQELAKQLSVILSQERGQGAGGREQRGEPHT